MPCPQASIDYTEAESKAISAIRRMTYAMWQMGAEHVDFHNHFADAQQRLKSLKNSNGVEELDPEVVRSTALDPYLSPGNLPKVMAFGHMHMEQALKKFGEEEVRLGNLQKETEKRVQALVNDEDYKSGDGKNAGA